MPRDNVYDDAVGATADYVDADKVSYCPSVLADWDGNTDPGNVDGALDQLAERVDDNEITLGTAITSSAVITDHVLIRGDGGVRGAQETGIMVDDTDNVLMPTDTRIFFRSAACYIYSDAVNQLTVLGLLKTTVGLAGTISLGDGTLRQCEPNIDLKINLGRASRRFNEVWAGGGIRTQYVTDNIAGAEPTDAELDTAFGTPVAVGEGFMGILDDNGAGTAVFLCASDGTNWWYQAMTKAV